MQYQPNVYTSTSVIKLVLRQLINIFNIPTSYVIDLEYTKRDKLINVSEKVYRRKKKYLKSLTAFSLKLIFYTLYIKLI